MPAPVTMLWTGRPRKSKATRPGVLCASRDVGPQGIYKVSLPRPREVSVSDRRISDNGNSSFFA